MSVLPLYHRVFLALRDQIVNGVYDRASPMPSEKQLCGEYDVSRATIRKALDLLEEEGLIERRQGAPTYPKPLGYEVEPRRQNLDEVARERSYLKLYAGDVEMSYEVVVADKAMARQFDGEKQLGRVVRVREADGKPWSFVVSYLPLVIADQVDWAAIGSRAVISVVEELGYAFEKVEQSITATVADDEGAALMNVPVGSPLLRVSGLFIAADGKAFMRKDGYFHPESFEYRVTLSNRSE